MKRIITASFEVRVIIPPGGNVAAMQMAIITAIRDANLAKDTEGIIVKLKEKKVTYA